MSTEEPFIDLRHELIEEGYREMGDENVALAKAFKPLLIKLDFWREDDDTMGFTTEGYYKS